MKFIDDVFNLFCKEWIVFCWYKEVCIVYVVNYFVVYDVIFFWFFGINLFLVNDVINKLKLYIFVKCYYFGFRNYSIDIDY